MQPKRGIRLASENTITVASIYFLGGALLSLTGGCVAGSGLETASLDQTNIAASSSAFSLAETDTAENTAQEEQTAASASVPDAASVVSAEPAEDPDAPPTEATALANDSSSTTPALAAANAAVRTDESTSGIPTPSPRGTAEASSVPHAAQSADARAVEPVDEPVEDQSGATSAHQVATTGTVVLKNAAPETAGGTRATNAQGQTQQDQVPEKQAPTLLAKLFSNDRQRSARSPRGAAQTRSTRARQAKASEKSNQAGKPARSAASTGSALPGVRLQSLYSLSGEDSLDGQSARIELASAAGLAHLTPRFLIKQTDKVETACLKPALLGILKTVEHHYKKPVIITSGYRGSKKNRRVGGARHSRHMTCDAADIQMEGVGKWDMARYLRSLPGRGGVGTYCYTDSVHIDIGKERDWNWRCKRGK